MIEIELTQGQVAIVDDCDADLAKLKWYAKFDDHTKSYYARRTTGTRPNQKTQLMHRVIMERILGRPLLRHEHVDHIYHNTLDNRRSELRLTTNAQNTANQRKGLNTSSRYKGVYWVKQCCKWRSLIGITGSRLKHLGYFINEDDAARAYDRAAIERYGEYANLNFPNERYIRIQEINVHK